MGTVSWVCVQVKPERCWARARSRIFFFFQAEDGIRDLTVTGVQTCALPIFGLGLLAFAAFAGCAWLWCTIRGARRPWGRLLVLSSVIVGLVNMLVLEQHQLDRKSVV